MVDGKLFLFKKVMFYNEDCNFILQKDDDLNKFYCMDFEYGKVVDEWNVYEDIFVVIFVFENKFVQMIYEFMFFGISKNVLYCIDFCLFGIKLVDVQFKQYVSKNDFFVIFIIEKGYIVVVFNKGDICFFDCFGINVKIYIFVFGEFIIGFDVFVDGCWVFGICCIYLLLIDVQ